VLEGDIEPGDETKLLTRLIMYATIYSPDLPGVVYLRSKGGDVFEAMKIGALVRRLRLRTDAPMKITGHPEVFCNVWLADESNCICASACFLAYAGGVDRSGTVLALHRPSVPKPIASRLSDVEYEAIEKDAIARTTDYLRTMEIDQFFIDKMMSTNSQETYHVNMLETIKYRLATTVPSIEEILLAKCPAVTSQGESTIDHTMTEGQRQRMTAKIIEALDCKDRALSEIRRAAFRRELEAIRSRP
jgi:hypothetical protein